MLIPLEVFPLGITSLPPETVYINPDMIVQMEDETYDGDEDAHAWITMNTGRRHIATEDSGTLLPRLNEFATGNHIALQLHHIENVMTHNG